MSLQFKAVDNSQIPFFKRILKENNLPYRDINEKKMNLFLIYDDSGFIGTVGCEKFQEVALLRSLVVIEEVRNKGYGGKICTKILNMLGASGVREVYLLTTTVPEFFHSQGFVVVSRDIVPEIIKATGEFSGLCPKSAICMGIKI